jgi:hypothetical protein
LTHFGVAQLEVKFDKASGGLSEAKKGEEGT